MSGEPPKPTSTPETSQRPKRSIHLWRLTAQEIERNRRYVDVQAENIKALLPWLRPGPLNSAWRSYVSPVDAASPDPAADASPFRVA